MRISRGDLFIANLDPTLGSELKKTRQVIVVSNNTSNEFSATITVVPVTSQKLKKTYPFEVLLPERMPGLTKESKAKANQIRTIDKQRLSKKLGALDDVTMAKLARALKIHLDI